MSRWKRALAGTALVLALGAFCAAGPVAADELRQVNGTHWSDASDLEKRAYLIGVANMMDAEWTYAQKTAPNTGRKTLSERTAQALGDLTIDDMLKRIDHWYQANPSRLDTPVIAVIWLDMVKPASGQ